MKYTLIVFLLFFISGCASKTLEEGVNQMKLTSSAFSEGEKIPLQYTCDGKNMSPPLQMSNIPQGTQSLALIMDDPDIPEAAKKQFNIQVWDHWIVFNIPPTTREIFEGIQPQGMIGKNTRGNLTYTGPCPPDKEHRYFFKLYALNTMLSLSEGATKKELETAMQGHILAQAQLIGRYERQR